MITFAFDTRHLCVAVTKFLASFNAIKNNPHNGKKLTYN